MTTVEQATEFETVIGLEVHVELATATKMFCGCAIDFGGQPNSRTCPVCLGQPGSLPVVNARAIEYALKLGLALHCEITASSHFHRKNYFYPDMPKNYQISQYDIAICERGHLDLDLPDGATRRVGINRVHMEEDTGKTTHIGRSGRIHGADYSLVDYNRAGIPLLEVVSEPDLRSADEAQAYLTELRAIVLALGISDAKLEEGSMRCDANVSVRPRGHTIFGSRVEVKNLNSIRSLGRAIAFEVTRQREQVRAGEPVVQETRHWDEDAGRTWTLRRKEEVFDYRYFPDPDLVPVEPDPAWVDGLRAALPELPASRRQRLQDEHDIDADRVRTLVATGLDRVLEDAIAAGAPASSASKWLTNEVLAWSNEQDRDPAGVLAGRDLAELISLVDSGALSTKLAREVLVEVLSDGASPREVVAARGLEQVSDTGELERYVDEAIAAQPDAAEQVRSGNHKAIGALVGTVMRATKGKANPRLVNDLLRDRLVS